MGRTFLVWVIFILCAIDILLQIGSIVFLYSGAIAWPREVTARLDAVSSDEIAVNLLVSLYWLVAGTTLFMMRRIALPLFLLGIPVDLLHYGWTVYLHGSDLFAETRSMVVAVIAVALSLLICFYVWTLDRRGMLA